MLSAAMGAFDATTKFLIETYAADWLRLADVRVGGRAVAVVDAELSTIQSVPDKIIIVGRGRRRFAVHVEIQTGRDADLDERVLAYNVLARRRHRMPVWSVVVLLAPAAAPAGLRGGVRWADPTGSPLSFDYQLVRTWELSADALLAGGLGTLPLAPIAAVDRAGAAAVIRHMRDRLGREAAPPLAAELWLATDILLGLRYPDPVVRMLMQGVQTMRESTSYQRILSEGRVEGLIQGEVQGERKMLIEFGTRKFGPPTPAVLARLAAVTDADELSRLGARLWDVAGWDELLNG